MDVNKLLASAGLRTTRQRRLILTSLMNYGSPLSHGELIAAISEEIDRVTLYRTLETLAHAGIVHQVQGTDGVWRFCAHDMEGDSCPGDHPHFLCVSCGKMFCLTNQKMPRVDTEEGFEVEGKQLVVYGQCPECKKMQSMQSKSEVQK